MRIGLHGTPGETADTITALRQILEVSNESRLYLDRPPSRMQCMYVRVTIPEKEDAQ